MGSKYSSQAASGYASSPPADDGSATESNKVKFSTIRSKLTDVLKTFIESVNTALVTAFDQSCRTVAASDSAAATDHNRTIQVTTSSVTITLADATTMAAGYIVSVANQSGGNITVALATSTNTIDTVTNAAPTIAAFETRRYIVNTAATGYLTASTSGVPTGTVMDYAGSTAPGGWLECDGSAVSRSTYSKLFALVSTTWGTGDGSTTFNLPDFRDKVRIGKGTGTVTASGDTDDVDTTADTLTVASNNTKWITGMSVLFNLTSGTITGLSDNTTYYVIRASSTTIKLASTLANAQAGTAIDLTAKSSPVWDIKHTFTARTLGEYGGEEAHAMSSTELLAHTHTYTRQQSANTFAAGAGNHLVTAAGDTTGSTGGNAAMNNMQPFAVTMAIIKT